MFKASVPTDNPNDNYFNVSSYGKFPYNLFSPFTTSEGFRIPVPGQDLYARNVESVWQGLKIINGETDFKLFERNPKKRKGFFEGHLFGDEILNVVDARNKIYKPAYEFYLDNYIPDEITSELLRKGIYDTIFFYDVDHNLDIEDDSSALAHSAFLAEYFNKFMEKSMKHIQRVFLKAYNPDAESETLAEPLSRALEELPTLDVILVDHFLRTHTEKNVSLQRYYGKILDRI